VRVLVCGGRKFNDFNLVWKHLAPFLRQGSVTIIHGAAPGADTLAGDFAKLWNLPEQAFPANWTDLSQPDAVIRARKDGTKYDARAGHRRNQQMIDDGKPDLVIAFPGGTGTADMVNRAKKAGIPVREIK
jgi:hypothetical protein